MIFFEGPERPPRAIFEGLAGHFGIIAGRGLRNIALDEIYHRWHCPDFQILSYWFQLVSYFVAIISNNSTPTEPVLDTNYRRRDHSCRCPLLSSKIEGCTWSMSQQHCAILSLFLDTSKHVSDCKWVRHPRYSIHSIWTLTLLNEGVEIHTCVVIQYFWFFCVFLVCLMNFDSVLSWLKVATTTLILILE